MNKFWLAGILAILLFTANQAHADGGFDPASGNLSTQTMTTPADSAGPQTGLGAGQGILTTPEENPIRLTPDKTRVLRLEEDAASVVVTNPRHAAVVLDSARLLVIMPREPGTTAFTVLDRSGRTILERNIIVTGAQQKYIRVRKSCSGNDANCAPSSYFYCPDGCYEVTPVDGDSGTPDVPEETGAAVVPNVEQNNSPPALPVDDPSIDPNSSPTGPQ
jgi:hypothetical protein